MSEIVSHSVTYVLGLVSMAVLLRFCHKLKRCFWFHHCSGQSGQDDKGQYRIHLSLRPVLVDRNSASYHALSPIRLEQLPPEQTEGFKRILFFTDKQRRDFLDRMNEQPLQKTLNAGRLNAVITTKTGQAILNWFTTD